jgi:ATP-binding cassette subfamily F protein 3
MLQIKTLTCRIAGHPLLERAQATIDRGWRVGLVGRNGSGKTTLLKLIAGRIGPDEGEISVPRSWRIGAVAQEAPNGPESLLETVLAADRERTDLLAEAERARDPGRIAEIHERLAAIGADSAPARAARILAGLGFDEAAQAGPCAELSGGWRMRVALAALLFSAPDLMLLDEPTNHLDLEATLWLEAFLKRYPGTLVLVSHDRDLLNRVPDKILHLQARKLTLYGGNYDRFERTRRERQAHQAALQVKQMAERRHIQAFIDRFRYKASKARQAQSRIKALERMEPIASVVDARTVTFRFPEAKGLAPPLMTLDQAAVGYGVDRPVLRHLNLRLDPDDRIALLGPNGNGKSTLVKLLAGRLQASGGRLFRAPKLSIGYFAQDQAEELDLEATALDHVARLLPKTLPERRRAHLGAFGFGQDQAEVPVRDLSGGEKARLLFALMSRGVPQMLLLDEPTNHLDVDSRQALVQALNDFAGAVVLVTHDPHLIELVADRLWLVADGTVAPFDGDLDDYRRLLQDRGRAGRPKARAASGPSRKDKRRAAAEARAATAQLRRAAKQAEARLHELARQKTALEAKLAGPPVSQGPGAELVALQVELGEVRRAIAQAEETWLEAQAALEEA